MANENEINATNIHSGIGSQVLAASLVLLGIALGYFDIRNIELASWKGVLLLLVIILLICSILIGSLGLKLLRDNGNTGIWDYSKTHLHFRTQTIATLMALILFTGVFLMKSEPSTQEKQLDDVNKNLIKLIALDSVKFRQHEDVINRLDSIIKNQKKLPSEIKMIRQKCGTRAKKK